MFIKQFLESKKKPSSTVDEGAIEYILLKNGKSSIFEGDVFSLDDLSLVDKQRYAWIEYFRKYKESGFGIYHLTVTYNEFSDRALGKAEISRLFSEYYLNYFLKKIVGNNYTRPTKNKMQPVVVAFIDEHESKASSLEFDKFGDRYHIHAVIAAHPDTVESFEALLGENTLKDRSSKHCGLIKTTFLSHASDYCAAYASKKKYHYSDFMIFGPKKLDS